MSGFWILLLRKEALEQLRTMRVLAIGALFLVTGIGSPLLAKYTPEIVKAMLTTPLEIPTPTAADAVDQLLKNVGQFGALAAILLSMGAVAGEKDRGTAAFMLTKPVGRGTFLTAKLAAIAGLLGFGMVLAGVGAYTYTAILFETLPAGGFVAACVVTWLSLVAYASVTFLLSTITRSPMAAGGLAFVALIATSVVAALPTVGPYLPQSLSTPAKALALGLDGSMLPGPLLVTIVLIAAALGLAWASFRRQEL